VIFWSGAYKRPTIGAEKREEMPGAEISKRRNEKITTDVQRIEVAASGDLAYEFSYGTVDYDPSGPAQRHVAFRTGLLRVWKKVDGDWKVAAVFVRPLQ
jgi:ketosteroid isomerase-like protein